MYNKKSQNESKTNVSAQPKIDKHFLQSQGHTAQKKANLENKTGLPDNLKSGIESMSGMDMSDVKVHYNSDKPAQLQAHAYAQGSEIHLANGQEKHLPHEAWHVVQQKQGRVQPTTQMKGTNINNDNALEQEADHMGARALSTQASPTQLKTASPTNAPAQLLGQVRFTNIKPSIDAKAQTVQAQLLASPLVKAYLEDKDCVIRLEDPSSDDTPAEVIEQSGQVQVSIAPWFFEQSSVGEILGMLAHEFAVHPMGDWMVGTHGKQAENMQAHGGAQMDSHYHKPKLLGFGKGETYKLSKDGHNQQDHLFMTKKDETRARGYLRVTFELAEGILERVKTGGTDTSLDDMERLIISYLGDVAMTALTNDHKPAIADMGIWEKKDLLPLLKQVMAFWDEECAKHGENGEIIKEHSHKWAKGIEQAQGFMEKNNSKGSYAPQHVETNEHFNMGGYSANQLSTMQAMGWHGNPLEITDANQVANLVTVLGLGSGVADASASAMVAFGNVANMTHPLNQVFNKIIDPTQVLLAYPNGIDRETIAFLGEVYQMEISILEKNGKINVLTNGAGKAVIAQKQDDSFALVHTV